MVQSGNAECATVVRVSFHCFAVILNLALFRATIERMPAFWAFSRTSQSRVNICSTPPQPCWPRCLSSCSLLFVACFGYRAVASHDLLAPLGCFVVDRKGGSSRLWDDKCLAKCKASLSNVLSSLHLSCCPRTRMFSSLPETDQRRKPFVF